MSIISGFLNQTISIVSSVATDKYGDIVKTTKYTNVPCRWQEGLKVVSDTLKHVKEFSIEVWISSDYTVTYTDVITYSSSDYAIIDIIKRYDLDGNLDHYQLVLE